jgi:hypothetical protein
MFDKYGLLGYNSMGRLALNQAHGDFVSNEAVLTYDLTP